MKEMFTTTQTTFSSSILILFYFILILFLAYFTYFCCEHVFKEAFVPINVYELPDNIKDPVEQYDLFGTLVGNVNESEFAISYSLQTLIEDITKLLNSTGIGTFRIISVDNVQYFTMTGVTIQNLETLSTEKFARLDILPNPDDPTKIHKLLLTPNRLIPTSDDAHNIVPYDENKDSVFRIKNSLHLFAPYRTSDNDVNPITPLEAKGLIESSPTTTTSLPTNKKI